MEKGWHIYSQTVPESGPQPTRFSFEPSKGYKLLGKTGEPQPITEFEKTFDMELSYFENYVVFQQRVNLVESSPTITGKVDRKRTRLNSSHHSAPRIPSSALQKTQAIPKN